MLLPEVLAAMLGARVSHDPADSPMSPRRIARALGGVIPASQDEMRRELATIRGELATIRGELARIEAWRVGLRSMLALACSVYSGDLRRFADALHDAMDDERVPDLTMRTTIDPPTAGDIGPVVVVCPECRARNLVIADAHCPRCQGLGLVGDVPFDKRPTDRLPRTALGGVRDAEIEDGPARPKDGPHGHC